MRVPAADIDVEALEAAVQGAIPGIRHTALRLEFLPAGEDSYVYAGGGLFVRLQRNRDGLGLDRALEAAGRLPLAFVLKPLATFHFGHYFAAVFPFVAGRILGTGELRDAGRRLAGLHRIRMDGLRRERFSHPFTPSLEKVKASGLLTAAETGRVCVLSDEIAALGEELAAEPIEFVVTHGDPNTHNWLVENGRLWLCDWGDIAMGPRERDLFAFSEPALRDAWEGYGRVPDERVLEFYRLRWVLQEIADYGTRLLDPVCPAEECDHARAELGRYVR